jgi:hypothetical protein
MPFRIRSRALGANMSEPANVHMAVLRLVLAMGCYVGIVYYLLHHIEPAYAQLAAVLLTVVVAPFLVTSTFTIVTEWVRFARDQPLERWHGNYYSFDGYQVRIIEDGGRTWIVLNDAAARAKMQVGESELKALGPDALLHLEEFKTRAISDEALLTLLSRRNYPDANKFRLWLQRDVLPPLHRKRTGERVPYAFERPPAAPESTEPVVIPEKKPPRTNKSKW